MSKKINEPNNLEKKYFTKLYDATKIKQSLDLFDLDFDDAWWVIFTKQKFRFLARILSNILLYGFLAVLPLLIGISINNGDLLIFTSVIIVWFFVYLMTFLNTRNYIIAHNSVLYNVVFYAHKFLQTVDPIAHSTRSSGQILSKVGRLEKNYEELMSLLDGDIIPFIIKSLTLTFVLSSFEISLGIISMVFILIAAFSDWITRVFINLIFSRQKILASDRAKSVEVESLAQIPLIRSAFATPEQLKKIQAKELEVYSVSGASWRINNYSIFLTRLLLLAGTVILSWQVFSLMQAGVLTQTVGISILITYIGGSGDSIAIGKRFQNAMQAVIEIKDTFTFIRNFGKQTYPVLEGEGIGLKN